MHLDVDDTEALALGRLLDWYLPELAHEIADTDNQEFREGLKEDEHALRALRARLAGAARPTVHG
jgi:hypothetical protein